MDCIASNSLVIYTSIMHDSFYSNSITLWLRTVKKHALQILSTEMGFKVGSSRFTVGKFTYPLNLVAFEHPSKLGYFEIGSFTVGIHKGFMLLTDTRELLNLLRHELAHYICYIENGKLAMPHGKEFHAICRRYGWPPQVSAACDEVERLVQLGFSSTEKSKSILQKIEKLLALSKSGNPHEAESAMVKANALMLQHNLKIPLKEADDPLLCTRRVLSSRRVTAKMSAIAEILHTFLVLPVMSKGDGSHYLEVFGDTENVDIAEYIASFLDREMEASWEHAKQKNPALLGASAKNSFFRGFAAGYVEKTKQADKDQAPSDIKAIVAMRELVETKASMAFPHLRTRMTRISHHHAAHLSGKKEGMSLTIREGLSKTSLKSFIGWNAK